MLDQISIGVWVVVLAGALGFMFPTAFQLTPGDRPLIDHEAWLLGNTSPPPTMIAPHASGRVSETTPAPDAHPPRTVDYGTYAFQVETLDHKSIELTGFAGNVVLVNFWAPWCTPCRLETPGFVRVYEKYKGAGLVILGIGVNTNEKDVQAFVKRYNVHYPVGIQRENSISDRYRVYAIPSSFLFAPDGKLHHRFDGFASESELEKKIEELLRKKA